MSSTVDIVVCTLEGPNCQDFFFWPDFSSLFMNFEVEIGVQEYTRYVWFGLDVDNR